LTFPRKPIKWNHGAADYVLVSTRQLVPDSGWPLKARFFKESGQCRIELSRYGCPQTAAK
jgi:hypothetical protein